MVPLRESAMRSTSPDTVKNCWVKCRIKTPAYEEDLRTGTRRDGRAADDERGGLPAHTVNELSNLLANMGKKLVTNQRSLVPMVSLQDLVGMPI